MVRAMVPADCQVEFLEHGTGPASHMSIDAPEFEAARQALSEEWNIPAAFIGWWVHPHRGIFPRDHGRDPLLIGFGKDDDQLHSPNEKYDMESFHKGIRSWARILDKLAGRHGPIRPTGPLGTV